jgi:predicted ferric reductase
MINEQMLARYLKDASLPVYYIAGPPGMVKELHMMINESGVDERDIRTEEFSGY